jgi:hypothetical protein
MGWGHCGVINAAIGADQHNCACAGRLSGCREEPNARASKAAMTDAALSDRPDDLNFAGRRREA